MHLLCVLIVVCIIEHSMLKQNCTVTRDRDVLCWGCCWRPLTSMIIVMQGITEADLPQSEADVLATRKVLYA